MIWWQKSLIVFTALVQILLNFNTSKGLCLSDEQFEV